MLRRPRFQQLARIRVVGVGYGGITAVNAMINAGIQGVDFLTFDSNARDLKRSQAPHCIYAAADSDVEDRAARRELHAALGGSDIVFIVGGLGGETCTHLMPLVASVARNVGALTTAIVTSPFSFEGAVRAQQAHQAITLLKTALNTLVVVPNDRLLSIAGGALAFHQTYELALRIWRQSIQAISELVNAPGLINVDFADVRAIMGSGGPSVIAIGSACGPDRARRAAEQATNSPFLEVTIDGAQGVLFNISGGSEMTLDEVRQAAMVIRQRADPDVNLIFGATISEALTEEIRVTLIATGCGRAVRGPHLQGVTTGASTPEFWSAESVMAPVIRH